MDDSVDYKSIAKHYESCFEKYGDSAKGVDWPNEREAQNRYEVMHGLFENEQDAYSLLDLGCGAGHFLEYLSQKEAISNAKYHGIDLSQEFIDHCQSKFPDYEWSQRDVLEDGLNSSYDYIVMNGLFTEKLALSFEQMVDFWKEMLTSVFPKTKKGIAFNVMSSHVDWQRDDLFHLPLDTMADFVVKNLSRHYTIRRDYNLYEYTVYVYQNPVIS